MAIKYYLQPNPMTPDPNDQSARVLAGKVLGQEDLVKEMLRRGSTLTEADVRAALNLFFRVVIEEVQEGNSINLPICNIRPGISGVFNSATDTVDRGRHMIKASLTAGNELYNRMLTAPVEKITQPMPAPALIEFHDVHSSSANSKLSPGSIGTIVGEELKFNPANAVEGIFFVSLADRKESKVTTLAMRTEGKLMFSIPSLEPGTYSLEVRKGYGATGANLRSGALNELLVVS